MNINKKSLRVGSEMLVGHFIIFISPFFAGHHISARWQLSQVWTEDCNVFLVIRVLLTNTDHGHSLHITNTHNNARGLCRCVVTFTNHLNGRIHSVCCAMSMMYKYLCFSAPLQSSLVSTINFRLCFVNPPNFYRITPKLTFMKYVLYLHVRIAARG